MQLPCAVVSVITDECDPEKLAPVYIEEIVETAQNSEPELTMLFVKTIQIL